MAQQIITQLQIISPTAGIITFDSSNYILQSIEGLDFPAMRMPRYNLPGQSGAFVSNQLYGERVIKIKGVVNAPDGRVNTYLTNRTNFINAVSISRDSSDSLQPLTLRITLQNGQIFTIDAYISTGLSMSFAEDQIEWAEFLLQLVAPDPNLYSSTSTSGSVSLPVGGGTAIPTAIPISLAPSSGGQITLNNIGPLNSYPTITITSPITNPYIVNLTTGQFISIIYTVGISDSALVIDCKNQTIFQGTNNVTGIQSSDSSFWYLVPGNNLIGFLATAGSGSATILFYPTFVGI